MKNSEPAFPSEPTVSGDQTGRTRFKCTGLSKRELIAAMAMEKCLVAEGVPNGDRFYTYMAESAVKMADALLLELSKTEEG